MCSVLLYSVYLVLTFKLHVCAPVEVQDNVTDVNVVESEKPNQADTPQASEKNPVQQWFENLSKDTSANAQNTLNSFREWLSQTASNSNGSGSQNLPVMYMGSFQLLKMPMPQFTDIMSGVGNMATAAQTINKLTGLAQGLPIPGLSKT